MLQVSFGEQVLDIEIHDGPFYRDDLTGQFLDAKFVKESRKKELDFFETKGVWVKRAIGDARRRMGKPPISVRWERYRAKQPIAPCRQTDPAAGRVGRLRPHASSRVLAHDPLAREHRH